VSGMVRAGLGISVVPALTLYQFSSPEISIRPIRWKGLTRHIYLVRRRDRDLSVAALALHDWVMAHPPKSANARATGTEAAEALPSSSRLRSGHQANRSGKPTR
jgi:LysR family carnitine catabolism transcriptional activator